MRTTAICRRSRLRRAAILRLAALCAMCMISPSGAQDVIFRVSPSGSNPAGTDSFYVNNFIAIGYWINGQGLNISEVHYPLEFTFSNGNLIGPVVEGDEFDFTGIGSDHFDTFAFDAAYGATATDPDTLTWSATGGDSTGQTVGTFAYLRLVPGDTGTIMIDSISLPSGTRLSALDLDGQPLGLDWAPRTIWIVPGEIELRARTGQFGNLLVAGQPGRIMFEAVSTGLTLADLTYPLEYEFTRGNLIGPLAAGISVIADSGALMFDSALWSTVYEGATDPDTTLFRFVSGGGVYLKGTVAMWSIEFTPPDTGTIIIDSLTLPGGFALGATDTNGVPVSIRWSPDTIRVVNDINVIFDVTTGDGGDTIYLGGPAEILFTIASSPHQISGITWPVFWEFTHGNIVGPLTAGVNVFPSAKAQAAFESINFNPIFGQGTDPDTSLYGFVDFGGTAWEGSGTVWSVTFTPADTGTIILDSSWFGLPPSSAGWPNAVSPLAQSLPSIYAQDTIFVVERPVVVGLKTGLGNDMLHVGQPGAIIFTVDANGYNVASLTFPFEVVFSNGNLIGPISEMSGEVVPSGAATSRFENISWNAQYGQGTDPDTLLYEFMDLGGPLWAISGEVWRIELTPSDTGTIRFDSSLLPPSGVPLRATDGQSNPLPIRWLGDQKEIQVVVAEVVLAVTTISGTDTVFEGSPVQLFFNMDAKGYQVASIIWGLQWTFSHGNIVGPLGEFTSVWPGGKALAAFESISWNSQYGQGTDPDTILYGFVDFGGTTWEGDGTMWRVEFVPADTGTIWLEAASAPPASSVMRAVDPNANSLPTQWTPEQIVVAPCPVSLMGDVNVDGAVNATDLIYMVNYIFKSGPDPLPERSAGDVNCSGGLGATDIIYLVVYIFKSGAPPCECFMRRI